MKNIKLWHEGIDQKYSLRLIYDDHHEYYLGIADSNGIIFMDGILCSVTDILLYTRINIKYLKYFDFKYDKTHAITREQLKELKTVIDFETMGYVYENTIVNERSSAIRGL